MIGRYSAEEWSGCSVQIAFPFDDALSLSLESRSSTDWPKAGVSGCKISQ